MKENKIMDILSDIIITNKITYTYI